jgi:DNA adenine methylase
MMAASPKMLIGAMGQIELATDMLVARPFIKWAGGKGQLLPDLLRYMPKNFRRYHEPFAGGAALFFSLYTSGTIPRGGVLSDYNSELIDCYRTVRDQVDALIELLWQHASQHSQDYFLEVRSWDRQPGFLQRSLVERTARMIFLNRTCYNGLYRLNRRGQFNAPFGHYKNPLICDPENLRAVSQALQNIDLATGDFADVRHRAQPGDLVYFDPPYVPVSATASFTSYTGQGFGEAEQHRLAELFFELAARGVHVMLSNSATPLAKELYVGKVPSAIVHASRKINCNGLKRGLVEELIVWSYEGLKG